MTKKLMQLGFGILVAAIMSLAIPSVRTWASEEGGYIYHWLFVNGPLEVFTTNTWTDAKGTAHTGLEVNSGTKTAATALSMRFLGAMLTSARPACASGTEGDFIYDTAYHALAFCDGTLWHRLSSGGVNGPDTWTEY